MDKDTCLTCNGDGIWCGVHSTPDGCDCEDDAPRVECPDCLGAGICEDEDEDNDE
jgi:hypothetical protein